MDVKIVERSAQATVTIRTVEDVLRVRIPLALEGHERYEVMILDADDSVDIVVKHPDGEREIVWSIVKAPEGL